MNNACIVQQVYSNSPYIAMLQLTIVRHLNYAAKHKIDYWSIISDVSDKLGGVGNGGWAKISLITNALKTHDYVFWIDADAAIVDHSVDLRTAFNGGLIGACQHPGPPVHLNVGVMFFYRDDRTFKFLDAWLRRWPGELPWMEQGAFNVIARENRDIIFRMDDKWNSTVNVTEVVNPVIAAWHGPFTPDHRLKMMKEALWQPERA